MVCGQVDTGALVHDDTSFRTIEAMVNPAAGR